MGLHRQLSEKVKPEGRQLLLAAGSSFLTSHCTYQLLSPIPVPFLPSRIRPRPSTWWRCYSAVPLSLAVVLPRTHHAHLPRETKGRCRLGRMASSQLRSIREGPVARPHRSSLVSCPDHLSEGRSDGLGTRL